MKLDKDTVAKNKFWFCLGGFGLAWLIGLLVLMFGASSAIEAKKKEFETAQQNIAAQNSVKREGPPETNPWLQPWAKYEDKYRSHKETIWGQAWIPQKNMITWPSSANAPLQQIWNDAGSMKAWVNWFNKRIRISQAEQTDYKNFLYLAQFLENPAEPNGPYKLVQLVEPVAFNGGRAGFEAMMAPTTGAPATGQGSELPGYPGARYSPAPGPRPYGPGPMGEGQQNATGTGITNFWQQLPTPEEMFLAQEDFWVKRELLHVVRDTLDHVSAFTRAKDEPAPEGYVAKHTFTNRNWEITFLIERAGNTRFISDKSTIKNIDPSRRILSLTDPMSKKGIRFELRQGDVSYVLTVNGEPLAPGQSIPFNRRTQVDTVVLDRPFDLYQKFDWFNSPIRRIDALKLAYHSHRTANIPLKPSAHFPLETESSESEFEDPNSEFGPMEPGFEMTDPNALGTQPAVNVTPANNLLRDRYVHVTEVCRHLPLAMSVVLEQEYINTLVTKLVNSPIRFQVTQIQVERATDVLPPVPEGQPGTGQVTEGGVNPMPFPMPFPMTAPGEGNPNMPGQPGQGNPRLAAGLNNLVRVDIYGIAALYERVPNKPQLPADGQPVNK